MHEAQDDAANVRPGELARSAGERPVWKRAALYFAVGLIGFLIGFLPMWLKARERGRELEVRGRELTVSRMQNSLASAAVGARRGDYEPARQSASEFFKALREQVDGGDNSALTATQRNGLKPLLDPRDDVITLLARSDPAASDRLSDMYALYLQTMKAEVKSETTGAQGQ